MGRACDADRNLRTSAETRFSRFVLRAPYLLPFLPAVPLDVRVQPQVLQYGQVGPQDVELGAHAQGGADLGEGGARERERLQGRGRQRTLATHVGRAELVRGYMSRQVSQRGSRAGMQACFESRNTRTRSMLHARTLSIWWAMSYPLTVAVPEVGCSMPVRMWMVVVLPAYEERGCTVVTSTGRLAVLEGLRKVAQLHAVCISKVRSLVGTRTSSFPALPVP